MKFEDRLKGSIAETVIRTLFTDDGYRVIDSGIEHLVREVSCLEQQEYLALSFSKTLRKLADLIVLNKEQNKAHLIEVKYRQSWNCLLIRDLEEQVRFFKEITLVCINGSPKSSSETVSGATHLRAIELKYEDSSYKARKYKSKGPGEEGSFEWVTINEQMNISWWELAPVQFVFKEMKSMVHPEGHPKHGENTNTLLACRAIASLMNTQIWDVTS